jgi:hypothetical protein
MDNKRSEVRLRRLKTGRIIFNSKSSVMSCQLRDLSAHGARLRFGDYTGAPEEFTLSIPGEVDARLARRVWMANNEIGVRFVG